MSSSVLSDRDVNTMPLGTTSNEASGKPTGAHAHRQALQSRMGEDKQKQAYVSPSDGLMSPCTAKLSALKHKHIMNAKAKPTSLFAKSAATTESSQSTLDSEQLGTDVNSQEITQDSQKSPD